MYFRLIGWSSATSTHNLRLGLLSGASTSACAGAQTSGSTSVTLNTEPTPGWLLTWMSPPIMRARLREISRPRPVPPMRLRSELSAW
ncbi:hypothetical protein D9M69_591270 [compost metagenome]